MEIGPNATAAIQTVAVLLFLAMVAWLWDREGRR
jgi:hypothetical protein